MSRKNKWKSAFFILLIINLIMVGLGVFFIFKPSQGEFIQLEEQFEAKGTKTKFSMTKGDLNQLINYYVDKENVNSLMKYDVILADTVELYGTMPVFGKPIQLKLTFVPEAAENGDIILNQETISIGEFDLPVKYVMNFLANTYKFPKGVEVYPNEKLIYIHLSQIQMKNDMKIQMDEFDLKNDRISFQLLLEEN